MPQVEGVTLQQFDIVRKFPVPRNQKQVKSFLGLTGFWRRFIPQYSLISEALRELLINDRNISVDKGMR
jgi:hypothetical protein